MSGLQIHRPDTGVVELHLDRPEQRNALTTALLEQLYRAIVDLGEDRTVRVVVLTADGPAFCAGADLNEFPRDEPVDPADTLARVRLVIRCVRGLAELEAVTIAAVQGVAIGAGWGLALGCDLCWVTEQARFALPEVPAGLRLPRAIVERLAAVVGPRRAAEIILSGEPLDGPAALQLGIATRSFPSAQQLHDAALERAGTLASVPSGNLRSAMEPLRLFLVRGTVPDIDYQWPES